MMRDRDPIAIATFLMVALDSGSRIILREKATKPVGRSATALHFPPFARRLSSVAAPAALPPVLSGPVATHDTSARAPAAAPATVAAAPEAERRQLTVAYCDLVGSTALSTGMDPEDLRDVIASYQNRCSAAIRHYDGFVAKYMGDGILVYFGYPRAHEDEAERSVRAGLDIVDAMAELNAAVPQAARGPQPQQEPQHRPRDPQQPREPLRFRPGLLRSVLRSGRLLSH